jgi:hypothetical protein
MARFEYLKMMAAAAEKTMRILKGRLNSQCTCNHTPFALYFSPVAGFNPWGESPTAEKECTTVSLPARPSVV